MIYKKNILKVFFILLGFNLNSQNFFILDSRSPQELIAAGDHYHSGNPGTNYDFNEVFVDGNLQNSGYVIHVDRDHLEQAILDYRRVNPLSNNVWVYRFDTTGTDSRTVLAGLIRQTATTLRLIRHVTGMNFTQQQLIQPQALLPESIIRNQRALDLVDRFQRLVQASIRSFQFGINYAIDVPLTQLSTARQLRFFPNEQYQVAATVRDPFIRIQPVDAEFDAHADVELDDEDWENFFAEEDEEDEEDLGIYLMQQFENGGNVQEPPTPQPPPLNHLPYPDPNYHLRFCIAGGSN